MQICNLLLLTGVGDSTLVSFFKGSDGDELDGCNGGFLDRLGLVTVIPGVVSSTFSYRKHNVCSI